MEKTIAEFVLLALGTIMIVFPATMVDLQVWSQRVLMKAQFIPSLRTYKAVRLIGILLFILGFLVLLGVLK